MTLAAQFEIEYLQYLGPDGKLVRDDLPPALVVRVREALLDMAAQDAGRALLRRLAIERFNPADDARYRTAMQAFLDDYRAKVGTLP